MNSEDKFDFYVKRGGDNPEGLTREEVRKMIQKVLGYSLNLITLIGSGASLPAVPLMSTTFSNIRNELKNQEDDKSKKMYDTLEDSVKKICQKEITKKDLIDKGLVDKNSVEKEIQGEGDINRIYEEAYNKVYAEYNDIEKFLSWIKYRIDGDLDEEGNYKNLFDYVKDRFIQSVKDVNDDVANKAEDNYLKVIQGLGTSRQILARHQKTVFDIVNLFTTNYDLFHENALEKSHYSYTDGFTNGIYNSFSNREFHRRPIDLEDRFKDKLQPVNPFFRLIKLHGSINWIKINNKRSDKKEVVRLSDIDFNNQNKSEKVKGEGNNEVLISPTNSKFALTQDEPYSDLFREFVNIMAIPNSVLFTAGFSFNDSHISSLIKSALDRTDFTMYAFISSKNNKVSHFEKLMEGVSKSPNVVIIYPSSKYEEKETPLDFKDFAYFMQPSTIGEDIKMEEERNEPQ